MIVRKHDIYGVPCEYYPTRTLSNPGRNLNTNANSLFRYQIESLAILILLRAI